MNGTVSQEQIVAACTALGLDPTEVRSLHVEPTGVEVVSFCRDASGKKVPLPDEEQGRNGHWYRTETSQLTVEDGVA